MDSLIDNCKYTALKITSGLRGSQFVVFVTLYHCFKFEEIKKIKEQKTKTNKRIDFLLLTTEAHLRPPPRLARKMNKSTFTPLGEADIVKTRRPATVREEKAATVVEGDGDIEDLDAKADDFTERFSQ